MNVLKDILNSPRAGFGTLEASLKKDLEEAKTGLERIQVRHHRADHLRLKLTGGQDELETAKTTSREVEERLKGELENSRGSLDTTRVRLSGTGMLHL